jgi:hypothetical protein
MIVRKDLRDQQQVVISLECLDKPTANIDDNLLRQLVHGQADLCRSRRATCSTCSTLDQIR